MTDEVSKPSYTSKIKIIALVIALCFCASVVIAYPSLICLFDESKCGSGGLTSTYSNITVSKAYTLLNSGKTINLIDNPTGCHCRYDDEHIGDPTKYEAILVTRLPYYSVKALYNTTNDTIIYDDDGKGEGLVDCYALINHVYGKIYYLEGGLDAWKAKGYPVIKAVVN